FSRDLRTWQRDDRRPVIVRGPAGSFDAGLVLVAPQPLVVGNEIWLYYVGLDGSHLSRSRRGYAAVAKWRLDGFASLTNGGFEPGVITTKPIQVTGQNLLVNAQVTGSLRVEILDGQGSIIGGFSQSDSDALTGNKVDLLSSWHGESALGGLLGKTVMLRFYLDGG